MLPGGGPEEGLIAGLAPGCGPSPGVTAGPGPAVGGSSGGRAVGSSKDSAKRSMDER
jgi:hypothetical protein